jgi:hypothetical protein
MSGMATAYSFVDVLKAHGWNLTRVAVINQLIALVKRTVVRVGHTVRNAINDHYITQEYLAKYSTDVNNYQLISRACAGKIKFPTATLSATLWCRCAT